MAASRLAWASSSLFATMTVLIAHVVLKGVGFEKVYTLASRVPTLRRAPQADRQAQLDLVFATVDRACSRICRYSYCVQRASSAATLLRLRGYPAVIVIGVRRPPFEAHAWVEVEAVPIGETPEGLAGYTVIRRSGPAVAWFSRGRREVGLSKI
jgi:hypothetical protein